MNLLEEAPVVTEEPAEELKCQARAHLGRDIITGWEEIECTVKATAMFYSVCGGPERSVFICQALADVYIQGFGDGADCAFCLRPLSEDWVVTPL